MTTLHYIILITCLFAVGIQSINLANSSYPMYKANPEKNNQLNAPFLCPSVTPGRTLVFNDTWTSPNVLNAVLLPPILSEDKFYMVANESSQYSIRSYILGRKPSWSGDSFPYIHAIPTILRDGTVALSGINTSVIVSSNFSRVIANWTSYAAEVVQALVPFGNGYLVIDTPTVPDDGHYSSVVLTISSSAVSYNSMLGATRGFFVNQNSTQIGGEAVVRLQVQTDNNIIALLSVPYGTAKATGYNPGPLHPDVDPFMVDQVVYMFGDNSSIGVLSWNIVSGEGANLTSFLKEIHLLTFVAGHIQLVAKHTSSGRSSVIRVTDHSGSKSLGSFSTSTGDVIMDFFNNVTLFEGKRFAGPPTYSITDNVAVFTTVDQNGELQLMGLDMDTWEVKATGLFDQVPPYAKVSEAVFDGNCNVYVTVENGVIHTLSPLPISNVVPMIECIDEFNVAYFTYYNYEQDSFKIPFVADRNALTPDNVAPITVFKVGQGDQYLFSTRVQLQNASATYQWRLEDNTLNFSITPQLACPRDISIVLTFTSSGKFNQDSFVNIVIDALVAVTGVRRSRVSVVSVTVNNNGARRNIRQSESTLEVELEISAGNSSEPTPAQVVTNLINNQYTEFTNQVTSSPDAPTDTHLNDIAAKVASPSSPKAPQASTNTPVSPPLTSMGSPSLRVVSLRAVLFALVTLVMWH